MSSPIVVVTGASGGIGRATALHFAKRGWRVALLARGEAGLKNARAEIEAIGSRALVIPTDVADCAQVERAAEQIERELGPIDVWINNAMATIYGEFEQVTPEDFRRATDVTYLGTVWGTRAALKHMRARNRGTIVQVGSALAYRSIPLQAPYCAAKAAVRGFTDSLRSELLHQRLNVHLTMVQLSAFNTPQFDWGRALIKYRPQPVPPIFQPEVAAEGIYFAATHRRREICVGWPAAKAIFANKFIPGLLDRYLAKDAYDGQHTDEPLEPNHRDNLYDPLPQDHGAHGRFDERSQNYSTQLWLNKNRVAVAAVAAFGATLFATMRVLKENRERRIYRF